MTEPSTIDKYVQAMAAGFQSKKAGQLKVTYQLQVTGKGGGTWTVAVANGKCQVSPGAPARADTSITLSTDQYLKLAAGKLNGVDAYNRGQIQVSGNTAYALKFVELFPAWASLLAPEAPPAPSPAPPAPKPTPGAPGLADYVLAMSKGFQPDKAGNLRVTYQFQLTGPAGGTWTATVANRTCAISEGASSSPTVSIVMSGDDFIKLARGQLDTNQAYRQGHIQISGDLNLANKITAMFVPWAGAVEKSPQPAPTPGPGPKPAPAPVPTPQPTPSPKPAPQPSPGGPVNPTLLNGSFDDYQPYVLDGKTQFWKEPQFPERYGSDWTLMVISEGERRCHLMDSETFGKFTQKYFGGGGRDYHIHGRHSQVIASRSAFDVVFMQTVAAQPGREYTLGGSMVSFYKGTSGAPVHDKVFKTLGIDPTGGRDYRGPKVVWGERDGRDNEWRYPRLRAKAQGNTITVFIRIENIDPDVGATELNIIHLEDFKLES